MPPFSVEIATACLLVTVLLADMLSRHGTRSIRVVFIAGILVVLGIAVAARGDAG